MFFFKILKILFILSFNPFIFYFFIEEKLILQNTNRATTNKQYTKHNWTTRGFIEK